MSWKAGDKALRINPPSKDREDYIWPKGEVKQGTTYLVEGLYVDDFGGLGLVLAGLPTIWARTGTVIGWAHENFRKVVPQCDREEMTQEERITELIEIKYPNLA